MLMRSQRPFICKEMQVILVNSVVNPKRIIYIYIYNLSGANPTIASYNASVVNFYNATGSLARFEKNIIFYF
jgi:hypothetical protein